MVSYSLKLILYIFHDLNILCFITNFSVLRFKNIDRFKSLKYTKVVQWNLTVLIDWKFVVALGTAAVGTIFALNMDSSAAERVSIHAIEATKEFAVATKSNC